MLINNKIAEAERIVRKAARWNNKNFDDIINQVTGKGAEMEKLLEKRKLGGEYEIESALTHKSVVELALPCVEPEAERVHDKPASKDISNEDKNDQDSILKDVYNDFNYNEATKSAADKDLNENIDTNCEFKIDASSNIDENTAYNNVLEICSRIAHRNGASTSKPDSTPDVSSDNSQNVTHAVCSADSPEQIPQMYVASLSDIAHETPSSIEANENASAEKHNFAPIESHKNVPENELECTLPLTEKLDNNVTVNTDSQENASQRGIEPPPNVCPNQSQAIVSPNELEATFSLNEPQVNNYPKEQESTTSSNKLQENATSSASHAKVFPYSHVQDSKSTAAMEMPSHVNDLSICGTSAIPLETDSRKYTTPGDGDALYPSTETREEFRVQRLNASHFFRERIILINSLILWLTW